MTVNTVQIINKLPSITFVSVASQLINSGSLSEAITVFSDYIDKDFCLKTHPKLDSVIGNNDESKARIYYSNYGDFYLGIGVHDKIVVDDSTQEIEYCGLHCIVVGKDDTVFVNNSYINDYYHSFGKGRAVYYLKESLKTIGFSADDCDSMLKNFSDLTRLANLQ